MTAIKAIETKYGGYRFRSRLEARWAVFFDHAGLREEWEYEPQGYEIPTYLGTLRYLPDFWIDSSAQWAEVKGFLDLGGVRRMHAIALSLTACGKGNDLAVFGEVPRPHSALWPVQLHAHGSKLWAVAWEPHSAGCPLERPRVAVEPTEEMAEHLTRGFPFGCPDWAEDALGKARFARFEFGEHGA
jgi:hypothetical protein